MTFLYVETQVELVCSLAQAKLHCAVLACSTTGGGEPAGNPEGVRRLGAGLDAQRLRGHAHLPVGIRHQRMPGSGYRGRAAGSQDCLLDADRKQRLTSGEVLTPGSVTHSLARQGPGTAAQGHWAIAVCSPDPTDPSVGWLREGDRNGESTTSGTRLHGGGCPSSQRPTGTAMDGHLH